MQKLRLFLGGVGLSFAAHLQAADTVYLNATVVTLDESNTVAEAVAVRDGRILAVGTRGAALAAAGEDAVRVDLEGATLLPGFIDAHGHFPASGLVDLFYVDLNSPPIGSIETIDALVERLRAKAAESPPGTWIRGRGYDDTLLAENRHPARADLDRASMEHPIFITHISGHLAVANSLALEMAGIDASIQQPEGGRFRLDENGQPNGVMEEPAAFGRVSRLQPTFSNADMVAGIAASAEGYAAVGVTTAQTGAAGPPAVPQTLAALAAGRLPIRVQIWPVINTAMLMLDGQVKMEVPDDQDRVSIGAIKGFADGSIQGYTGFLTEPYHVQPPGETDYRGYPTLERDELARMVTRLHAAGYQLAIHGNGDAAIDNVLHALATAQAETPRDNPRHIVIHAQMVREDQLDAMAELGIIPSFFNLHTYYWGDRHRDIFMGPERAARMSPARSALDRDMRFTLHADTPVVPMHPMMIVWAAVNRQTSSGETIGPEQRIGVVDALKAITIHAAYQGFEEDEKGSIEAGKLADLVVLDRNPLDVPEAELRDIQVLKTIVGGEVVYVR